VDLAPQLPVQLEQNRPELIGQGSRVDRHSGKHFVNQVN
jgi:hypothetical protein